MHHVIRLIKTINYLYHGICLLAYIYWRFLICCGIICWQIIDEKSLIKKYQREISVLKLELDQLKKGMLVGVSHEEILTLKQKVFIFI